MARGKRARRLSSSTAAAADARGRGLLSFLRRDAPSKRPRRADDDGTPLTDGILLDIFARVPEVAVADLVRFAATCRRWRRLVSGDAAYIFHAASPRPPADPGGGRLCPPLALGYFHQLGDDAREPRPRFVPTTSASRRLPDLHRQPPPSLSALVGDGLLDSSYVVASRNGLLIVDLQPGNRRKRNRALRLCVCNPMTGAVHALPPLSGEDLLGRYACAVATAADYRGGNSDADPPSSFRFRLLVIYSRRGFTAFRSYDSPAAAGGGGGWSPEARVTGAQLSRKGMRNGVVAHGGRAAYWMAEQVLFRLRLDTLEATLSRLPWTRMSVDGRIADMENTSLGSTPDGRLCAVWLDLSWRNFATYKREARLCVYTHGGDGGEDTTLPWLSSWEQQTDFWVDRDQFRPDSMDTVKLRWFCEKSGVVFLATGNWWLRGRMTQVHAVNLATRAVVEVPTYAGNGEPWGDFYGYEMDLESYLTSL